VKIDPETGQLAGPDCPTSQTVNIAVQFAPRVECFKHLPVVDSESDITDLESSFETDSLGTDSEPEQLKPADEPSEPTVTSSDLQTDPAAEVRTPVVPAKVKRYDSN